MDSVDYSVEEEIFLILLIGSTASAAWYSVLWAMEGWGFVNFDWFRTIVGIPHGWTQNLLAIEAISIPLDDLKFLLTAWRSDDRFNPYENYGFYYMFNMFAYPLIYSLTTGFSVPVILLWPNFMFLYAIDRDLFVDWDATAEVSDLYMVPR